LSELRAICRTGTADALYCTLHLGRAEAGVLPDDRDDRDLDLRKNIGGHLDRRGDAEKQACRSSKNDTVAPSGLLISVIPHLRLFFGQCDADAEAEPAVTLRSSGTISVAMTKATMIARKASA
jgi:hypothetical protein